MNQIHLKIYQLKNFILEQKNQLLKKHFTNLKEDNPKLLKLNDQYENLKLCNNELLSNLRYQNQLMKDTISIAAFNNFLLKMQ